MISAQEIQQIEAHRRNLKKETYKHILEMFDKKIRTSVSLGLPHAILEIPEFVWGFPVYNISSASVYLKRQLEKLGYNVEQSEYSFKVTWGRSQLVHQETHEGDDDDLPSLVNLRKIATKIIQQKRNAGGRRGS